MSADIKEPELIFKLAALIFTPLKEFAEEGLLTSVRVALFLIIKLLKRYSPAGKDMSELTITSASLKSAIPFAFKSEESKLLSS